MSEATVVLQTRVHVRKNGLPDDALQAIRDCWTYPNPKYDAHQRMKEQELKDFEEAQKEGRRMKLRFAFRSAPGERIKVFDEDDDWISVPRGSGLNGIREILDVARIEPVVTDSRTQGDVIDVCLAPGIEMREYQAAAISEIVGMQRGYVLAPTASGKTIIGIGGIAEIKRCTLVVAHTTEILDGWLAEILGDEERDCEAKLAGDFKVTRIQGSKGALKAARTGDIILATVQTLYRASEEVWAALNERVGYVIPDEAHHAPADTFWYVFNRLAAKYRIGLTATDKRKDHMDFLLRDVIGPCIFEITEKTLVACGAILQPEVTFVPTGFYPEVWIKVRGKKIRNIQAEREIADSSYNRVELVNCMTRDENRNAVIVRRVVSDWEAGYVCAVLTERVDHCDELHDLLEAKGMKVEILKGGGTSKVARKIKRQIVNSVIQGRTDAIVGTSILDEGINIPNLSALHLTCPSHNEGKMVQQVGRIRRPRGKCPPVVRDYVDSQCKAVLNSYRNRKRWYKKRGWTVHDIDPMSL